MGLKGAHTEFISQVKALPVRGCGAGALRRIVMHGDLAEQPEGLGMYASLMTSTGVSRVGKEWPRNSRER
jgi:hypothetical protein